MIYFAGLLQQYISQVFYFWVVVIILGISFFVTLLEATELIRRSMVNTSVSLRLIAEMALLKLPSHLGHFLPFIILATTMMVLWRFNYSKELIIIRSIGISAWQLLLGLIFHTFIVGFLYLIIIHPLSTALIQRFHNLENVYFHSKQTSSGRFFFTETGLWMREASRDYQRITHFSKINPETKVMKEITFFHFSPKGALIERIDADQGELKGGLWHLKEAHVIQFKKQFESTYFSTFTLPTVLKPFNLQDSANNPETITLWKMTEFIDILEQSGLSSLRYRLYWHAQFAKLALMVSMVLVAAIACLSIRKRHGFFYIGFGVITGFIVYFFNDLIMALGMSTKIPIILAAWSPAFVVLLLSTSILLHQEDG